MIKQIPYDYIAEVIKSFRGLDLIDRAARIHRRSIQKDLNDPDSHDGVITHLEPDILECEVKWALGSVTMNKASIGDGNLVELFQTQNMML